MLKSVGSGSFSYTFTNPSMIACTLGHSGAAPRMFTSKSMSPRLARKSESVACAIARWKITWLLESLQFGASALKPGACEWMSVMSGNATVTSAPFHALYRAVPSWIAATAHSGSGMPSTVHAGAALRRMAAVAAVMPRNVRLENFICRSFLSAP